MPELSTLDERLAEIDERLRSLQSGLEPSDGPALEGPPAPAIESAPAPEPSLPAPTPLRSAPPATASAPEVRVGLADASDRDDPTERVLAELTELSAAHERLLELHRDLLSQYAALLERRVAETTSVSVVAGPFADGPALRAFERDLGGLPGVTGVSTREFLSGDRVAVDVRLAAR